MTEAPCPANRNLGEDERAHLRRVARVSEGVGDWTEDKRRAVLQLLAEDPRATDHDIARRCGASVGLVARLRAERQRLAGRRRA